MILEDENLKQELFNDNFTQHSYYYSNIMTNEPYDNSFLEFYYSEEEILIKLLITEQSYYNPKGITHD